MTRHHQKRDRDGTYNIRSGIECSSLKISAKQLFEWRHFDKIDGFLGIIAACLVIYELKWIIEAKNE